MSYIQLLTKIKNAQVLHRETVRFPYSKLNDSVLEVLTKTGFIASYEKKGRNPKKFFDIQLSFKNGESVIHGMKFVSTPSRKLYVQSTGLHSVRQGHGTAIISTSHGIMSDNEARKKKIGGQILFNIW